MFKNKLDRKPEIDLTGPSGNAYVLLGLADKWAKELGLDHEKIEEDMKSGNYEHLLEVLEENFGEYVDLIR